MKKTHRILACVLLVGILFAFGSTAFAKNHEIYFSLTPNGPSKYDGHGSKGDSDTKCYITTTGGTGITLNYKMRGKKCTRTGDVVSYNNATGLGSYSGKITSKTLSYIDPYKSQISAGNYAQYEFALACSLHSGTTDKNYSITGKWNP